MSDTPNDLAKDLAAIHMKDGTTINIDTTNGAVLDGDLNPIMVAGTDDIPARLSGGNTVNVTAANGADTLTIYPAHDHSGNLRGATIMTTQLGPIDFHPNDLVTRSKGNGEMELKAQGFGGFDDVLANIGAHHLDEVLAIKDGPSFDCATAGDDCLKALHTVIETLDKGAGRGA